MLVGANKWCGRPPFYVGLTLTHLLPKEKVWTKNKRREEMTKHILHTHTHTHTHIYKTKVIKESDFDTPITLSKEEKNEDQ